MENKILAITTIDNPYDPINEFKDWYTYDTLNGYFTSERLAKKVYFSDSLSQDEINMQLENAIDELIEEGAFNKRNEFVPLKKIEREEVK